MKISAHTSIPLQPARTSSARPTAATRLAQRPVSPGEGFANIFQNLGAASTTTAVTTTATTTTDVTTPTTVTPTTTPDTAVPPATLTTTTPTTTPGIQALANAIVNGTLQVSYVTDPSKLLETSPAGTDYMPSMYYASDQTANQIAQLLGGTVVQKAPFGHAPGYNTPLANFIQLPNGMTVNAADLAYYARCGKLGTAQITADLTQTINVAAAWSNWQANGGSMPSFPIGYIGPPISGMTYPPGSIGTDGNVINPSA